MGQYQSFPDAAGASRTIEKLKALNLPELSGRSFLDVGCNEGFFCGFAHYVGADRSVGIDNSKEFIGRARERFPKCEFHRQSWDKLPDGPFDVILLASAIHYADDQPGLIRHLVNHLSPDGILVLELGVVAAPNAEWFKVKRGIDERYFPSMAMLTSVLENYAWKWMGPSVAQSGDPVKRQVIHISRRRSIAYLLLLPPAYGKTSVARDLFGSSTIPLLSGDGLLGKISRKKCKTSKRLQTLIAEDFSPFSIDQTVQKVFQQGLGDELVDTWISESGGGDFAIEGYVPATFHADVQRRLVEHGYFPVNLQWEKPGPKLYSRGKRAKQADSYFQSLAGDVVADTSEIGTQVFHPAGFVEDIHVGEGIVRIRGWAIDEQGRLPMNLLVRINGKVVNLTDFEKQSRSDVKKAMGVPDALVGYEIEINTSAIGDPDQPMETANILVLHPSGVPLQMAAALYEATCATSTT